MHPVTLRTSISNRYAYLRLALGMFNKYGYFMAWADTNDVNRNTKETKDIVFSFVRTLELSPVTSGDSVIDRVAQSLETALCNPVILLIVWQQATCTHRSLSVHACILALGARDLQRVLIRGADCRWVYAPGHAHDASRGVFVFST